MQQTTQRLGRQYGCTSLYDPRLRAPVHQAELAIDPLTGMKNYIANETGGWAISTRYVKHSLTRSIHFGLLYTSGGQGVAGREEGLCEALRCLGPALHCLEDFSAHQLRGTDPS